MDLQSTLADVQYDAKWYDDYNFSFRRNIKNAPFPGKPSGGPIKGFSDFANYGRIVDQIWTNDAGTVFDDLRPGNVKMGSLRLILLPLLPASAISS